MTRADQWAAFARAVAAIAAVALITAAASIEALRIGPSSAGLLYLLPVLWVSARAGLTAGLTTAGAAAFCYNFFLLEPRGTLRIHGVGDVTAFTVLMIVALVTSRLASDLRVREREADARAEASAAEAEFGALLSDQHDLDTLDAAALAFLSDRYGEAMLIRADDLAAGATRLAPLDAAAAAWALHNHDPSGRATAVMPSADFRFVPMARGGGDVLALAADGPGELPADRLAPALARLWTQARDRLIAEAERTAREGAEQREGVRRTLLAALGHDFRTPLTVLKSGLAEIGGEASWTLIREVDRVARLGEDLIAAARLDSGEPVRLEPVDLVDVLASAVPLSPEKPVETVLPDDLPLVRADAVMLVHILGNLVENALRHARTTVRVSAREAEGRVEVDVSDDGEGVDPAVAATLFDRFVSGSDRDGGSGLGLSIARDMAQAMGVTLAMVDAPDGGACFRLTLSLFAGEGDA